jgi:transcriptional regulator with XRE-family HTH domain
MLALPILDSSLKEVKAFSLQNMWRYFMLYAKIEAMCKKKGISIAALESSVGLGNATIRGWAKSSPTVDNLKKVADYFNVTVDDLMKEENPNG